MGRDGLQVGVLRRGVLIEARQSPSGCRARRVLIHKHGVRDVFRVPIDERHIPVFGDGSAVGSLGGSVPHGKRVEDKDQGLRGW